MRSYDLRDQILIYDSVAYLPNLYRDVSFINTIVRHTNSPIRSRQAAKSTFKRQLDNSALLLRAQNVNLKSTFAESLNVLKIP